VFNAVQKKQIIQKLTDAMVSVEGENMRGATWVKIFEVNSGEWGIWRQATDDRGRKRIGRGSTGGVTLVFGQLSPAGNSCWRQKFHTS